MTRDEFVQQVFALHRAGSYVQALELVEQQAPHFPEMAGDIAYFRICFTARLGQTRQALNTFADALDAGHWYAPDWLRREEDMASLQGEPAFQRMITTCEERLAAAKAAARPERILAEAGGEGPHPLVMVMHGNTSSAVREAESWRPLTGAGWDVAMLQSSQVIGPGRSVWNDQDLAIAEVKAHFAALTESRPVDRSRVMLGGFSRGAGLAVWLALTGELPVRGFVAMGPWLPDPAVLKELFAAGPVAHVRGYLVVGEQDQAAVDLAREIQERMTQHGLPCELEIHQGSGHHYPPGWGESLQKAAAFILGE